MITNLIEPVGNEVSNIQQQSDTRESNIWYISPPAISKRFIHSSHTDRLFSSHETVARALLCEHRARGSLANNESLSLPQFTR